MRKSEPFKKTYQQQNFASIGILAVALCKNYHVGQPCFSPLQHVGVPLDLRILALGIHAPTLNVVA